MTVQELLSKAEELLEVDITNVEEHETKTPGLIYKLSYYAATLWREANARKKMHVKAEARAQEKYAAQTGANGKPLTAKTIEAKVDLEPEVQQAWNKFIEVEMQKRQIEGMLDAMQRKSSYIPGLQGRLNAMRASISRE